VSITGYLNPGPMTGTTYYYFYDWVVNNGCKSNRVPATGVVISPPAPTVMQAGNTLTSSSPILNQWYMNGTLLPGDTNQVYVATGPGSYTVVVTDPVTGCTSESMAVVIVSVPENGLSQAGVTLYPNPAGETVYLRLDRPVNGRLVVYASDGKRLAEAVIGPEDHELRLNLAGWPAGVYLVGLTTADGIYHARFSHTGMR
jgi:DNA-binding beta-propeller fold protein YncE